MSSVSRWSSSSAVLLALGVVAGTAAPLVTSAPASAQVSFSDVRNHWAREFITKLAAENVIAGFPDGTFKPDVPVTRAQFAAIVRQAFNQNAVRQSRGFSDVPTNYWAAPAIQEAYETGFMAGYPGNRFLPSQEIPKAQVLISLSSGLRYSPTPPTSSDLSVYADASQIPDYAVNGVAAATEKKLVVNYPDVKYLNPTETATRGDVAAYIYQALASQGEFQPLPARAEGAQYIVGGTGSTTQTGTNTTPTTQNPDLKVARDTPIDVQYVGGRKVLMPVSRGETVAVTLEVATDVKNSKNQVLIPKGSQIKGELKPVKATGGSTLGTQFDAQEVVIGGKSYPLNATSGIVTTGSAKQPTQSTSPQNVVTSAATRAVLGAILGGQINTGSITSILTGEASKTPVDSANDIIYIDPATDLDLKINSDFYASSAS